MAKMTRVTMTDYDHALESMKRLKPLEKRKLLVALTESLMDVSDDAFAVYAGVFATIDEPETILVLGS